MKRLIRVFFALVLVVVIALVAAFVWIDRLAKAGIEHGTSYALGVQTSLEEIDIEVLAGKCSLSRLQVANPGGFDSPHFLTLDSGEVEVSLGSLRQDTVEVSRLGLSGIDVNLERKGGEKNYQVILDNVGRFESAEETEEAEKGEGKKFVIREVDIRDVTVHIDLVPVGGELTKFEVEVPEIQLHDLGSDGEQGMPITEVTGVLLKAILQSAIENGKGVIPLDFASDLTTTLSGLKSIGDFGLDFTGQVGDVGKDVGEAVKKVGEGAGEVLKGFGGFLPKKEDQDE